MSALTNGRELSAFVARLLVRRQTQSPLSIRRVDLPLTCREREVLVKIAEGYSNKEIAKTLAISDQTVKNHITSILRKLRVADRTSAAMLALRQGYFSLDELRFAQVYCEEV